MPIDVSCPRCGHAYAVKDDAAGRKFKCKDCGGVIEVPGAPLGAEPSGSAAVDDDPFASAADRADDEVAAGRGAAIPRRRRGDDESPQPAHPFGKASLIIGCIVWGLAVIGFVILMVMGFSAAQMLEQNNGRAPGPNDPQTMTLGFMVLGACGFGCIGYLMAIVGTILGVIAVSQPSDSKSHAIGGVILNGLFLLGGTGLIVVSILVGRH